MSQPSPFRLAALAFAAFVSPASAETRLAAVDAVVEPYVGEGAPGIAVLVMRSGAALHMAGYGVRDIEMGAPVDENTVFDLASVSKQMTALAAMLAIEDGRLSTDTPLEDLLPPFAESDTGERPVTVGDLLHHLSGLPDYLSDEADGLDYGPRTTNAEIVDWLAEQPLDAAPGTRFSYSNSGYLALANVVAAADEADSLAEVLRARIWEPLGMTRTGLVRPAAGAASSRAKGYEGTEGRFEPSFEPSVTEGDGNVLSTISDLARYEAALDGNRLLPEAATTRLFENGRFDDGRPLRQEGKGSDGYGFGWNLTPAEAPEYAWHSGSWMGTSTYYQRNLDTGTTVIVLANGEDLEGGEVAEAVEAAVEAEEP